MRASRKARRRCVTSGLLAQSQLWIKKNCGRARSRTIRSWWGRSDGCGLAHRLAAGDCSHDQKRLRTRYDFGGQRRVGRLVGQILLTGEEPHERPALLLDMIT